MNTNKINILVVLAATVFSFLIYTMSKSLEPYMDEIFHIPQAQKYCRYEYFRWDPKITTYPGLYVISSLMYKLMQKECSIDSLRFVNVLTSLLFYIILTICYSKLWTQKVTNKDTTSALDIMIPLFLYIYPINSFYYFLYYTDTMSMFWLIVTYAIVINDGEVRNMSSNHVNQQQQQQQKQHAPHRSIITNSILCIVSSFKYCLIL